MAGFNVAFHCKTPISTDEPKMFRCPKIEAGIKEFQEKGKNFLMSLGGAELFAYRVYHLLLEGDELQNVRPFGRLVILRCLVLF